MVGCWRYVDFVDVVIGILTNVPLNIFLWLYFIQWGNSTALSKEYEKVSFIFHFSFFPLSYFVSSSTVFIFILLLVMTFFRFWLDISTVRPTGSVFGMSVCDICLFMQRCFNTIFSHFIFFFSLLQKRNRSFDWQFKCILNHFPPVGAPTNIHRMNIWTLIYHLWMLLNRKIISMLKQKKVKGAREYSFLFWSCLCVYINWMLNWILNTYEP